MKTRDRILATARDQFLALGFSKVTMDEIAGELGMSKKTLYRFFPGKKALLEESILQQVERIARGMAEIAGREGLAFAERLEQMMVFMNREVPRPSDVFLRDIPRSAPDLWRELDRRRHQAVGSAFGRLFEEGRRQGALRSNIDPDLLILVVTVLIQQILQPRVLSRLPISNVQALEMIMEVLLLGALSESGRKQVEERWPSPH